MYDLNSDMTRFPIWSYGGHGLSVVNNIKFATEKTFVWGLNNALLSENGSSIMKQDNWEGLGGVVLERIMHLLFLGF